MMIYPKKNYNNIIYKMGNSPVKQEGGIYMSKKMYAAGVGVLKGFVGAQWIVNAKTLTESSVEITSAVEEIRGGRGNGLIG